MMTGSVSA
jgi:hypothetical protein